MGYPAIFYDNRFADAAPAASTTATGYDVANLGDFRPYTEWQPTALPATVTVDCGAAAAADYAAVWGHDLNTQGATFEVRGSTDNFSASDVLVDSVTPSADDPFLLQWASTSYRYWRFRLTGTTMPTLGIAVAGTALEIPSWLREGFDPVGREPQGIFNRSVGGMPLGRTVAYEEWRQTLNFELLSWTWLRASWLPAWQAHLRGNPFVMAWDAANYPAELALATVDGGFRTPHRAGGYADLQFDLTGLLA